MDKFNLNVYVEQVNQGADNTTGKWEENEEQALSNVIDPNTEFKLKESKSSTVVNPSNSYGLSCGGECKKETSSSQELIQLQSECLDKELEQSLEGYKNRRSASDFSLVAKVHAYTSSQGQCMDPEAQILFSHNRLVQYPPDRITVVTEKSGNVMESCHKLSAASSHESISTLSVASEPFNRNLMNMISESSCRLDRSLTTADQLAWEFRRARDRLDTASNISGCSSHFELDSERTETMSTISDVSGYEEEMFRIKRLLLLDSTTPTPPPIKYNKTSAKEHVGIEIDRLTTALAEKESVASENKMIVEWQEKYHKVLRQNAHLEGRLETVEGEKRELIERNKALEQTGEKTAIQEMERLALEINKLCQTVREAEHKNEDLAVQLEIKGSEINQLKREVQMIEDANEKLRIELQELKVDSESKDGAIQGLKIKISDQHIELQSLLQAKLKADNNVSSLKNEVESVKKSSCWYRDQLHACQSAKVKVQQELMSSQTNLLSQSHEVEKLKVEIANMQLIVEETQHRAVREKETLMRKLQVIQADILEREATIMSQIHKESTTDTINAIANKLKKIEEEKSRMSDAAVEELKEEIAALKNELHLKEMALQNVGTDNSHLVTRVTTLQEVLSERELALQLLENKCKNTEMSHNHLVENLKVKDELLLEMKNEKVAMEVALAAAGREKNEVDAAIDKLREDFTRITANYQAMKAELREKEKYVANLKTDKAGLENEKQTLIEKVRELKKVEEEFRVMQGRLSQTEVLEQQVEHLSKVNRELNAKIGEVSEAHGYVKEQVTRMEETISAREEQLMNQTRHFEVHSEELKSKEKVVIDLQNEKTYLENKIKGLLDLNKKLKQEIDSHKKQVLSANDAIEQFNLLCRKSEEEKDKLQKKLNQFIESGLPTSNRSVQNISKPVSTLENGYTLHNLHDLIQETESKFVQLLSEVGIPGDVKPKTDQTCGVVELDLIFSKLVNINDNVSRLISGRMRIPNSVGTQTVSDDAVKYKEQVEFYLKEISRLKGSLKISEIEHREKHRKYEINVRTLLKKVKEHMRGRKVAEKALEELQTKIENSPDGLQLKRQIEDLEAQLEASKKKYEEQRRLAEKNQEAMLELEKERGKLAQCCSNKLPAAEEMNSEFDQKTRELHLLRVEARVSDLVEQIHKLQVINKDLRKEIFTERCESSQLRKQVASLQMGLDTANDMLDTKKVELGRAESLCCLLRTNISHLKKQLEDEQEAHEQHKQETEILQTNLEETKAKDPVLADQIKTLSYHLHQKTQEAAGLQEKLRLCEERWLTTENGLQRNLSALEEELSALRSELDLVRGGKFTLQTHTAELTAALQSSIEQNKVLRLKLETYGCENKDRLPDLTSSLPLPPTKYDETGIAELLHQSTVLPHNKPLNNLQCCLDSLKEEMEVLQRQIAAKTSGRKNTNREKSYIKDV